MNHKQYVHQLWDIFSCYRNDLKKLIIPYQESKMAEMRHFQLLTYKLYVFIIFVLNKNFVKMHAHLNNAIIWFGGILYSSIAAKDI